MSMSTQFRIFSPETFVNDLRQIMILKLLDSFKCRSDYFYIRMPCILAQFKTDFVSWDGSSEYLLREVK
jgi:hypothetical protein